MNKKTNTNTKNSSKISKYPNKRTKSRLTESVLDEIIEGMAITIVRELVIAGWEFLKALGSDSSEISGELRVFRQDHRTPSHEAIDQRLLPHLQPNLSPNPNPNPRTLRWIPGRARTRTRPANEDSSSL